MTTLETLPGITLSIEEIAGAFIGRLEAVSPHISLHSPIYLRASLVEGGVRIQVAPCVYEPVEPAGAAEEA